MLTVQLMLSYGAQGNCPITHLPHPTCYEEFGCPDAWQDVLYSGSRLMLDDLDGFSEEEDMLFDPAFPE